MGFAEVLVLAIGVAMDAFAVSICKGITIRDKLIKKAIIVGVWFGCFQGLMPLIGYFLMGTVNDYLNNIKAYIIFGLLAYIGVTMIIESFKKEEFDSSLSVKTMLVLSVATSLDALSIGMTISLLQENIFMVVSVIAVVTFMFCFIGIIIGSKFGDKYKTKAGMLGGIILILIGLKILIEHFIV